MKEWKIDKSEVDWQIVPACLCTTGNPNSACPYQQSTDEDLMIKGIYSRYEAENTSSFEHNTDE